jgi:hypothetical protein
MPCPHPSQPHEPLTPIRAAAIERDGGEPCRELAVCAKRADPLEHRQENVLDDIVHIAIAPAEQPESEPANVRLMPADQLVKCLTFSMSGAGKQSLLITLAGGRLARVGALERNLES